MFRSRTLKRIAAVFGGGVVVMTMLGLMLVNAMIGWTEMHALEHALMPLCRDWRLGGGSKFELFLDLPNSRLNDDVGPHLLVKNVLKSVTCGTCQVRCPTLCRSANQGLEIFQTAHTSRVEVIM